jgi:Rieske Fe-S protein
MGGNIYAATFAQNPSLMTIGDGVTLNSVPGHINGVWVVQQSPGTFLALDLTCTHQGCPVSRQGSEFRCPCHGAIFSASGAHVSGPGNGPLQSLSVCGDSTGAYITG